MVRRMAEIQMTTEIIQEVRELGFEAIREPAILPDPNLAQRLWAWLRSRQEMPKPDLLVKHNGKSVLVEVRRRQAMFLDIELVLDYLDILDAKGVICVPDSEFPEIAGSVSKFADNVNVRISPISEIGDVVGRLLSSPDGNLQA